MRDVILKKILLIIVIMAICPSPVYAQRGCCSHHGGVVGCNSNGRQICRDGTLSPTCTCTPQVSYIYGCTDSTAKNYNARANKDNGSCTYYKYGCTKKDSLNYDATAEKDDGSCIAIIYGCMDEKAKNYNAKANTNNDNCIYEKQQSEETSNSDEADDIINTLAGLWITGASGALGYTLLKKRK